MPARLSPTTCGPSETALVEFENDLAPSFEVTPTAREIVAADERAELAASEGGSENSAPLRDGNDALPVLQ